MFHVMMRKRSCVKKAIAMLVILLMVCVFAESVNAASGRWIRTDGGWTYETEGGTRPKNQWSKIDDRWYYFGSNGVMSRGWQSIAGSWYYLGSPDNPDLGAMSTYWRQLDGKWFYFGSNGAMKRGWQKLDDSWYYFGSADNVSSGAMATGWRQLDGKWFYFGSNGAMKRGWQKLDDSWYYFGSADNASSGAMATGWHQIDGKWYYFGANGVMCHGWKEIEGTWYYLGHPDNLETGAMVTGVVNTKESSETAKYYYFAANGAWKKTCLTVSSDGSDWVVIKGIATKVVTESDRTLYRAMNVLTSITTDDMTDAEKLRAAFNHIKNDYPEFNTRVPHDRSYNWPVLYANDIFVGTGANRTGTKGGNCFSCAASFGYLAKAIGYTNVYACNSGGHGWIEMDGKVYDPEWERHNSGSFFARPLVGGEAQNYLGAISRSTISSSYFPL